MTAMNYKLLNFVKLKEVRLWDYLDNFNQQETLKSPFSIVRLGEVVKQRKKSIIIDDEKDYKRCRVQLHAKGIELRDIVKGAEIKTKKQQVCRNNDFLVAEIDAKNGGYGIVSENLEGAIVSSHYFLYEIDDTKLLPQFLELYIKTSAFFQQVKAVGSTNYAAIRPSHILDYKIPLPKIDIQKQLINQYNQKLTQAREAENQANELEKNIEDYFFEILGIKIPKKTVKKNGLQLISFKEISRWDFDYTVYQGENVFSALKKAKYPTLKLGQIYNFINRPWSNKKHQNKTFRYIEIGSVDAFLGIIGFSELETNKAPSRATQMVKENDLILGLTRPNLKKFAVVNKEYDGYVCSSGFQIISPSDNYNLEFLLEFLKSDAGVKQVSFFMAGALYPAITTNQLKNLEIPLPPNHIQTEIVDYMNTEKEKIKSLRQQAEELRKQAKETFENEIFA